MDIKVRIKNQLGKEIESLRDEKGFILAGKPDFARLFGRDSLIVSWQLLELEPSICKNTLSILSQLQGRKVDEEKEEEPGKILHETDLRLKRHPEGFFPFPYYGSIDSTPLFLILCGFYFKKTKDALFVQKHWKNIQRATDWILKYGDVDGDLFVEYKRKNRKGLFHQGWKDSFEDHLKIIPPVAIVEAQGYQYLALKEIASLAKRFGQLVWANQLLERAKRLKKAFNQKFWMPEKNYYVLALDGKKQQKKTVTSNPGHLLFTGICQKDKAKLAARRLFQKDLWTPYGIRTHSVLEPDFDPKSYHKGSIWPHDNWIIAQGLLELGYQKEYQRIKEALILAYQKLDFLPEYYGVIGGEITLDLEYPPCHPQAWASAALLNLITFS